MQELTSETSRVRTTIVDSSGVPRRLEWLAQNEPHFLIKEYYTRWPDRADAIYSVLKKYGYNRARMLETVSQHPEWRLDVGAIAQS